MDLNISDVGSLQFLQKRWRQSWVQAGFKEELIPSVVGTPMLAAGLGVIGAQSERGCAQAFNARFLEGDESGIAGSRVMGGAKYRGNHSHAVGGDDDGLDRLVRGNHGAANQPDCVARVGSTCRGELQPVVGENYHRHF